jgi:hypothetical protein
MWTQQQIKMLSNLFGRFNAFPSGNREDEFVIVREDGTKKGIFKEWAPPILPELSGMEIDKWREKARCSPAFLEKELRRAWRNSWLLDRELAVRFSSNPLPEDPQRRVMELVKRLKLAFGLMAPFYHLEAIVDDPGWLGLDDSANQATTGDLDVVAFLLPSAFQRYVVASNGNWNGLDWSEIRRLSAMALNSVPHAGILLGLAGLFGAPPLHLLFAANALQWIPARVGGKKEDVGEHEAIRELRGVIERSREIKRLSCISVLADMNARIRFFNWLPLVEGPENFVGRNWTYASVCDTTDELFKTLDAHLELWRSDFRDIYIAKLRPQVLNLDAASAKGRFLLDLIVNERKLTFDLIDQAKRHRYKRSTRLISRATYEFNQPCLVGTKPIGLAMAAHVLGQEHVLPGLAISMDAIENPRYKRFADEARSYWPEVKLWAVRSSSMDEGTARGIYKTILRVPPEDLEKAIKACVRSYHHKSAVAFRFAKGLDEKERRSEIAVLLQPYLAGRCGGVATVANSRGGGRKYHISVARTPEEATSGGKTREYEFSKGTQAPDDLVSLVSILDRLHNVFGGIIQVEWVMDEMSKIIILQMEFLPTKISKDIDDETTKAAVEVFINSEKDIETAFAEIQNSEKVVRLVVGPEMNLKSFQGELFTMIVRFSGRVREIQLANPVSPSSHFANICRHFGIKFFV